MSNLLEETLEILGREGKGPGDIRWVGSSDGTVHFDWDHFAELANKEYYPGYGSADVAIDLVVVGKDFWLERGEYDGSEWWEYKKLPTKKRLSKSSNVESVFTSYDRLSDSKVK